MEKNQTKQNKKDGANSNNSRSQIIKFEIRKLADYILKKANNKTAGRKIKYDDIVKYALSKLDQSDIEILKKESLSNEDRQEQLRQKYIKLRGKISKDEFIGFTMTVGFQDFLAELRQ